MTVRSDSGCLFGVAVFCWNGGVGERVQLLWCYRIPCVVSCPMMQWDVLVVSHWMLQVDWLYACKSLCLEGVTKHLHLLLPSDTIQLWIMFLHTGVLFVFLLTSCLLFKSGACHYSWLCMDVELNFCKFKIAYLTRVLCFSTLPIRKVLWRKTQCFVKR